MIAHPFRGLVTVDPDAPLGPRTRPRFKIARPRVPWARRAPRHTGLNLLSCGTRRITSRAEFTAQFKAAWFAKNCAGKRGAREFDAGGPDSGTLAGARRAAGLFDYGWGTEYPLTRREQKLRQEGIAVPDPFFAPPTTPHPSNWIEDKLQRLRGRFGPSPFVTPATLMPFCPEGGSGITCAGPNAEVVWTVAGRNLTAAEHATFRAAYCAPGVCVTGPLIAPPPGVKERIIYVKPRNPAVAVKASCQPVPQPGPVVQDRPTPPFTPAGPTPTDWSCGPTEQGCSGMNCVVNGQRREIHWRAGVPVDAMWSWFNANCH